MWSVLANVNHVQESNKSAVKSRVSAWFNLNKCDLVAVHAWDNFQMNVMNVSDRGIHGHESGNRITWQNAFNLLLNGMWVVRMEYSFNL